MIDFIEGEILKYIKYAGLVIAGMSHDWNSY